MATDGPRKRGWKGRSAAVLIALVVHASFLGFLLLSLPEAPPPPPPPIEVELVAPPMVSALPRRAASPIDQPEVPAASARSPALRPRLLERQDVAPVYVPSAPANLSPAPTPAAAPVAAGRPAPSQGADDGLAERLAGALRSVGCREDAGLTPRERERCNEQRGARTRDVQPAPLPSEKRREFDAVVRARTPEPNARDQVFHDQGIDCYGSNMGMGCMPKGRALPVGRPRKAIEAIPPSTLRGDDDALRPKPAPD